MKLIYFLASAACFALGLIYAVQAAIFVSARIHSQTLNAHYLGPSNISSLGVAAAWAAAEASILLVAGAFLLSRLLRE